MPHFSPMFRQFLIANGYKFAGFLLLIPSTDKHKKQEERMEEHQFEMNWSVAPLPDELSDRMEKGGRILNLKVVNDALRESN